MNIPDFGLHYEPKCGDSQPHDSHTHVTGHFKSVWCGGVCDCGGRGRVHGIGDHK